MPDNYIQIQKKQTYESYSNVPVITIEVKTSIQNKKSTATGEDALEFQVREIVSPAWHHTARGIISTYQRDRNNTRHVENSLNYSTLQTRKNLTG